MSGASGTSGPSGEIFLVDDNSSNLSLLAGILRDAGFRVRAANTGKRALGMIRAQRPELVMLDITMPEMDGYQVCAELKADEATRDIPVVFISALDEPLDKVKAFRAGGVDYVGKPFQAEEVVARVENQLKIWRLQRETEAKNAELERAYHQIQASQEQIARLSQPSAGRLEDTPGWAESMAAEVARAIGVREIGVWLIEDDRAVPLAPGGTSAPSIRRTSPTSPPELEAADGSSIVPVIGMASDPCGALVIAGTFTAFDETQRRLLGGLAHHLGTALEMRSLRRRLSEAASAQAVTRRQLHERGIETVLVCARCGRCVGDSGREGLAAPATCPDDGSEFDLSRVLPFRVLGRYRFERLLGEGGMGTVFSAYDESLERHVALKIIKAQLLGDPAMRFRLQREAKTVARIQHPGVTALFDTGELEDGSAFLVMELLRGRVLSGVLGSFGAGSPRQVAQILRETGAALSAAHRVGVVHRDVKPENIFLTTAPGADRFQTKLLDFGVALSTTFEARVTHTGIAVGTPGYMSPEQVQCTDLDERTDVYSLACVAWEALVGRRLVPAGQIGEMILNVLTAPVPPVSDVLPGAAPAIDRLFEEALGKSREARPRDIDTWASSLASLLEALEPEGGRGWPPARSWTEIPSPFGTHTQAPTFTMDTPSKDPA